jgi:serine/tyrosine/threonine adenylyltransferase
MKLKIQNKFTEILPADSITENYVRQVAGASFSYVTPEKPSNPKVIHVAEEVLELIGLEPKDATSKIF